MGELVALNGHRGYLLDTHTFLWAARNPKRLGKAARAALEAPDRRLYLSSFSAYEVARKHHIGKLDPSYAFVVENYTEVARRLGVTDLPVTLAHAYQAGQMDWPHRDPFDRVIAAQAALENLVLITNDAALGVHPWVETVW
ncbi:MAG: type II toxin-antitoxin system VapC family toxin [Coriobacteriales bacterium]|jgi:PIN domain nuclease of toxin-antitoxin system|nr:type II toxin-antitoxin system VapC family toxin [Coriobacteriales bacterium]